MTLIAGHIEVAVPAGIAVVGAESTAAMRDAVLDAVIDRRADALIMAAAVADFRPDHAAHDQAHPRRRAHDRARADGGHPGRGRRPGEGAPIPRPVIVGFAAETGSLERAPEKLRRKGADLLVANDVAEAGSGFGTDTNRVSILGADGSRDDLPLLTKREVADRLLDRVVALLDERGTRGRLDRRARRPIDERPDRVHRRLSVVDIAKLYADGVRIATITAYDFPTAALVDEAGIPLILVGRLAGPGDARLRHDRARVDGRDAPPHEGRRARVRSAR